MKSGIRAFTIKGQSNGGSSISDSKRQSIQSENHEDNKLQLIQNLFNDLEQKQSELAQLKQMLQNPHQIQEDQKTFNKRVFLIVSSLEDFISLSLDAIRVLQIDLQTLQVTLQQPQKVQEQTRQEGMESEQLRQNYEIKFQEQDYIIRKKEDLIEQYKQQLQQQNQYIEQLSGQLQDKDSQVDLYRLQLTERTNISATQEQIVSQKQYFENIVYQNNTIQLEMRKMSEYFKQFTKKVGSNESTQSMNSNSFASENQLTQIRTLINQVEGELIDNESAYKAIRVDWHMMKTKIEEKDLSHAFCNCLRALIEVVKQGRESNADFINTKEYMNHISALQEVDLNRDQTIANQISNANNEKKYPQVKQQMPVMKGKHQMPLRQETSTIKEEAQISQNSSRSRSYTKLKPNGYNIDIELGKLRNEKITTAYERPRSTAATARPTKNSSKNQNKQRNQNDGLIMNRTNVKSPEVMQAYFTNEEQKRSPNHISYKHHPNPSLFDYKKTSFNQHTLSSKDLKKDINHSKNSLSPSKHADLQRSSSPNKLYKLDIESVLLKEYKPLEKRSNSRSNKKQQQQQSLRKNDSKQNISPIQYLSQNNSISNKQLLESKKSSVSYNERNSKNEILKQRYLETRQQ